MRLVAIDKLLEDFDGVSRQISFAFGEVDTYLNLCRNHRLNV